MTSNRPYPVKVKLGSNYFWCSCGKSENQPFCDGSHAGSDYSPQKLTAEKTGTVYLCGCKKTSNSPFCNGSHNSLNPPELGNKNFSANVQPDNLNIEIMEDESILIASLRNNISHLSACGGGQENTQPTA